MLQRNNLYVDCYVVSINRVEWHVKQCVRCRCCMNKPFFTKGGWSNNGPAGVQCINCLPPTMLAEGAWEWDPTIDGPRTAEDVIAFNNVWPGFRKEILNQEERRAMVGDFTKSADKVAGVFVSSPESPPRRPPRRPTHAACRHRHQCLHSRNLRAPAARHPLDPLRPVAGSFSEKKAPRPKGSAHHRQGGLLQLFLRQFAQPSIWPR